MEDWRKQVPKWLWDHPAPVTRRQFLSMGLGGASALVFAPTLLGLLRNTRAEAASPPEPPVPFLIFDCAGGAALPGTFLVGKQGGPEDLLKSYSYLGWDPRASGAYDTRFGLPMAVNSPVTKGLLSKASPEALAGLRLSSFCHFGQDDAVINPLSPYFLLLASGYKGSVIQRGLGTLSTASGGNSLGVLPDETLKPVYVGMLSDLLETVKPGGGFVGFPKSQLTQFLNRLDKLSSLQIQKFEQTLDGQKAKGLLQAAAVENLGYANTDVNLDPRLDPIYQKIYSINPDSSPSPRHIVRAGVVKGVLDGTTGPGVISILDCDYHSGKEEPGLTKDFEIGEVIGSAVEAAYQSKKRLFFQILTDGGCSALPGTRAWVGDAGDKCLTVMGYYDPQGQQLSQRRIQVGHYTDAQGADRTTFLGGRADKVACAVFANYLNLQGRLPEIFSLVPNGLLTPADVDPLLVFG